jgi:hypothetical protein
LAAFVPFSIKVRQRSSLGAEPNTWSASEIDAASVERRLVDLPLRHASVRRLEGGRPISTFVPSHAFGATGSAWHVGGSKIGAARTV